MKPVIVIGAGLAGSEAAWQLARRGIPVELREMKPQKMTPAHHSPNFGELVCSNSLRSDQLENAVGLLKEELRRCGSLIMECADAHRVEAGGALAVDRHAFSAAITEKIRSHPNITVVEGEVLDLPAEGHVIVATGPLTSDALAEAILRRYPQNNYLHFFDAAAPLVTFESVDMDSAWFASRYDRGTPDYINCPLTEEEYQAFWEALTTAQEAEVHGFEDSGVFEGCMPVEVMARRGRDTLCYGPLKPVGLKDPRTGKEPFAVVQLRKDNAQGSIYAERGVCALWGHAPEYLPGLPPVAGPVLPGAHRAPHPLRRTGHRGGGLCGVHRLRLSGGHGALPGAFGEAPHRFSPGDRHRRFGSLHQ